jgi:hypothetical protein
MSQVPSKDMPAATSAAVGPHINVHAHAGAPLRKARLAPRLSLLRLSAGERLGGVTVLVVGLWALVYWALH